MSLIFEEDSRMLVEEFVTFDAYPNYAISNYGRIVNINSGRELKHTRQWNGYYKVDLSHKGTKKSFYVHRLIAKAFFADYQPGFAVKHINGDHRDNCILNLELTDELCREGEGGLW